MVGINNLYIAKIPNSCKECPLTYLDTGDDAYFGAYERRCVIDDSCVDGMASERAYDCPLVEAIPKADYKTDLIAMLTELQLDIEEHTITSGVTNQGTWNECIACCSSLIQQKINSLKENGNGNK